MQTNARAPQIDFVRGIAILLALGWHFNAPTGIAPLDILLTPGRAIGWAGVDLFFVLSGFLVGGLIFREYARSGSFYARRFLIRRAFKIWPVLYLYLILILLTGHRQWQEFLLQCLFHVQNYFRTPLTQLWSLAVEEHFYLGFAALASLAFSLKSLNATRFTLGATLVFLLIACLVLRALAVWHDVDPVSVQTLTHFRMDGLAVGVALAYTNQFHRASFEGLANRKVSLGCIALAAAIFNGMVSKQSPVGQTMGFTVAFVGSACFLLFCYQLPLIANNLLCRGIAWIGVYSYPIYVFQFVPYRTMEALFKRLHIEPSAPVWALLKYAGAIAIGVVISKLIERPCLALRDRLFPSMAEAPVARNLPATASAA